MADEKLPKSDATFANRIDPTKESLTREQMYFVRQVELEQWKKKSPQLRTRNIVTGLAMGALVLGICILVKHFTSTQGELRNVSLAC